jgi:hypothetical protein
MVVDEAFRSAQPQIGLGDVVGTTSGHSRLQIIMSPCVHLSEMVLAVWLTKYWNQRGFVQ